MFLYFSFEPAYILKNPRSCLFSQNEHYIKQVNYKITKMFFILERYSLVFLNNWKYDFNIIGIALLKPLTANQVANTSKWTYGMSISDLI